jgi:hypothetical protein
MLEQLYRLYDDLNDDGTQFRSPRTQESFKIDKFKVGRCEFRTFPYVSTRKGIIESSTVPGTHIRLPILMLATIVGASGYKSIVGDVADSLLDPQWVDIFKERGLMGFTYDGGPETLAVDRLLSAEQAVRITQHNAPGEDHVLNNGIWFSDHGVFYFIDDSIHFSTAQAPLNALSRFVKRVLPYYPEVKKWIANNPSKNSTDVLTWWKMLAVIMIQNGWNILWHGQLFSNKYSESEISKALKEVKDATDKLRWPPKAIIKIEDINERHSGFQKNWGQLLGSDVQIGSDLQSIVLRTVHNITQKYQHKLRS